MGGDPSFNGCQPIAKDSLPGKAAWHFQRIPFIGREIVNEISGARKATREQCFAWV